MLQKIAPVLPAYNIADTNLFYRNKLKFLTHNYGNYLIVRKDEVEIHFFEWTGIGKFVPASCYIIDNNVEDLFSKFSSMDLMNPKGNMKKNSLGKNEFQLVDNNGNVLRFGGI
ncbi:VOC family protein [soil metagenome]